MLLYKYLSPERIDVLKYHLVRFTQPKYLNDPFESRISIKAFVTDEYLDNNFSNFFEKNLTDANLDKVATEQGYNLTYEQRVLLKEVLRKQAKLTDYKDFVRQCENIIIPSVTDAASTAIYDCFGVFSLSACYDNLLMWAHYADSHKGFVVGFDIDDGTFNNKSTGMESKDLLRQVNYCCEKPQIVFIDFKPDELFFSKSTDWSYEQEWRVVRALKDADVVRNELYLFNFLPECVKEIYLGANIDEKTKNDIVGILKEGYRNIDLFEGKIDDKIYKLNFEKLIY